MAEGTVCGRSAHDQKATRVTRWTERTKVTLTQNELDIWVETSNFA